MNFSHQIAPEKKTRKARIEKLSFLSFLSSPPVRAGWNQPIKEVNTLMSQPLMAI